MKKVIIVLFVAVLTVSSIFAVEFSGRFRAGYTFTFNSDGNTQKDYTMQNGQAARWTMYGAISSETWSLFIWNADFASTNGYRVPISAYLTVYMDKIIANLPEDLSIAAIIGENGFGADNLPYSDPSGTVFSDGEGYIGLAGEGIVLGAQVGYKDYGVNVYVDPVGDKAALAEVYGSYEFISAGAAFQLEDSDLFELAGAFTFDIANVAKLDDISADASAYVYFEKDGDNTAYEVLASVSGGYKSISAYIEFVLANSAADNLKIGAGYKFDNGIKLSAEGIIDLTDAGAHTIGLTANYKTKDKINLYLYCGYAIKSSTFTVRPYVQVDF